MPGIGGEGSAALPATAAHHHDATGAGSPQYRVQYFARH